MKKILLLVFTFSYLSTSAQIKFVKVGGAGTGLGDSWENAAANLKTVLDDALDDDTIWVANGTYTTIYTIDPTSAERALSFTIPNGVKVFGGFAGDEPSTFNLDSRDFNTNETILSGDIGIQGNKIDNSYHVVYTQNVSSATLVDGFTIQDGNANSTSFPNDRGGGWFNTGRGSDNSSNPIIRNIIFKNNHASLKGGALCNDGYEGKTSPIILKCMFINNTSDATTGNGGAMYNEGLRGIASPLISNCVFSNNSAGKGGAIYNDGDEQFSVAGLASPAIINSTFYANSGNSGNVIYNTANMGGIAKPTIWNCIFDGSSSPLIENANSAEAIIDHIMVNVINLAAVGTSFTDKGGSLYNANPLFQDAINDNFQLKAGSPAINSGDNTAVEADLDLAGKPRIKSSTVDMGAYESSGKMYVDDSKTTAAKNGSSWTDAYIDLQDALQGASPKDTIWVARGTYKPTSTSDRTISFVIPDSVKVYGGFAGNEPTNYNLDLRDFTANETNLSGDIGTSNFNNDNSYHVVYTANVSPETVVDGFTIKDGRADGSFFVFTVYGGAWLAKSNSHLAIVNCIFKDNYAIFGGAMHISPSNPTITNCTFNENEANDSGGAMSIYFSYPTITNCTFNENKAVNDGGAIFSQTNDNTTIANFTNCSFFKNNSSVGGAIYNNSFSFNAPGSSTITLTNCTLANNTATINGGAIFNREGFDGASTVNINNSILWNNVVGSAQIHFYNQGATVTISNSLIQETSFADLNTNSNGGVTSVAGILFSTTPNYPQFIDAANGNLRLQNNSPAIDQGSNTGITHIEDITGQKHINAPDMGAY